jgi:hypothetical protein
MPLRQAASAGDIHSGRLSAPSSLPIRHVLAPQHTTSKLKPRFLGPYRVVELINDVIVRLELPLQDRIHDVFPVGTLKKFVETPPSAPQPLPDIHHGTVVPEATRVEQARLARGVQQVLIHWREESTTSTTWEDLDDFRAKYLDFQLEDELNLEGRRNVMWGAHLCTPAAGPRH